LRARGSSGTGGAAGSAGEQRNIDDQRKLGGGRIVEIPREVRSMGAILILAFLVLIGPLSYFFGVDSRRSTDRGWVGAAR
jgi:hypothetical protein